MNSKTIRVGDTTIKFELPQLRGAKALAASERRAALVHDYVMTWSGNAHLMDMARSDLQLALDERTSTAFWLKANMDTVRQLRAEGATLHI